MSLSPQWLDELRARVTLSGVIGRTTRLTKAGHEFKACCPFHNEKSPSFTVNDAKGFYHCFGCGAHGDVIRWMTDQRGLGFMDAIKELAAEAGMEVPAPDPRSAQAAERASGLHEVMKGAQDWFVSQLAGADGVKARGYLASRGFDAHTVARFGFGYAPEGRQALKGALSQVPDDMLEEAGLRIAVEGKDPYDRFRGRLMLPIEDARGRVIAFGGRILESSSSDAPKYLNSPDTPLFDKGQTLYNLHRAGPESRQTGRLIVVEGYMDVIALAAAGIGDAVAPLGTALTERQIEMLWRLVEAPILCFDGDAAGQRAAMRAVTRALPLLRPSHTLRICRLPTGLDPDDLIKREGAAAMHRVLEDAQSLIDTLWQHERDALPLTTPEEKAGLKARLMAHVEMISDQDIKALYRRELLEKYSAFAFPPREKTPFVPRGASSRNFRPPVQPASAEARHRLRSKPADELQRALCAAVVAGLHRWPAEVARNLDSLGRAAAMDRRIDAILDRFDEGPTLDSQAIATTLACGGMGLPAAVDYIGVNTDFLLEHLPPEEARNSLGEAISLLVDRPALQSALDAATQRHEREFSDETFGEQQALRKRLLEFDARLRQMASARAVPAPGADSKQMAE